MSYGPVAAEHSGKKALDTIFEACPLVTLLNGRKYGLLPGPHGSPGPPHAYPLMMPREANRCIHS